MVKITVKVYRRPDKGPIYSRLVVGQVLGEASHFPHGAPAWGFVEPGIVIVCTPAWEAAVSKFLAGQHDGQRVSTANGSSRAVPDRASPRGAWS